VTEVYAIIDGVEGHHGAWREGVQRSLGADFRMIGGGTVLMKIMKTCIAAAVALGCVLAVPGASFAAGDKDCTAARF
jgi:hypothetical protein